jgi:hypothetical protein
MYYDKTIKNFDDSLKAFVWRQYPTNEPYVSKIMGTYVDVWLTLDPGKIPISDTTKVKESK